MRSPVAARAIIPRVRKEADSLDPGWRPALTLAGRIITGRGAQGSMLLVMRAAVVLLSVAAVATAVGVLVFGGGSGEASMDETTARLGLFAAVGIAAAVISLVGRGGPDVADEIHLAVFVFQVTMRRVLAAAALGPAGLVLSWLAADGTFVIFGAGVAVLLMAVVAPTADRLRQWQADVAEAGSDLSVIGALSRPFR